jgi:hypothetical protein
MEQSSSLEAASTSVSQDISRILRKPTICFRVKTNPPTINLQFMPKKSNDSSADMVNRSQAG